MARLSIASLVLILALTAFLVPAGADFFQYTDREGTVVIVDDEGKIPAKYRKDTKAIKSLPGSDSKSTSVRIVGNRIYVPVRISYRSATVDAWLLLDTGASTTMISTALADRLGIKQGDTRQGLSQVADGRVLRTFITRVDSMAVGPKMKYNSEISIMPSSNGLVSDFDGLLGMNFLGDFSYRLDVNSQMIEWQQ